jgi:glucose-1-phosphate cytidylyltransferase
MVLSPKVLDLIDGDKTSFEREPLEKLVSKNQLNAYKHNGFWQCMDTLRDKEVLENLWNQGKAPWKIWED